MYPAWIRHLFALCRCLLCSCWCWEGILNISLNSESRCISWSPFLHHLSPVIFDPRAKMLLRNFRLQSQWRQFHITKHCSNLWQAWLERTGLSTKCLYICRRHFATDAFRSNSEGCSLLRFLLENIFTAECSADSSEHRRCNYGRIVMLRAQKISLLCHQSQGVVLYPCYTSVRMSFEASVIWLKCQVVLLH